MFDLVSIFRIVVVVALVLIVLALVLLHQLLSKKDMLLAHRTEQIEKDVREVKEIGEILLSKGFNLNPNKATKAKK